MAQPSNKLITEKDLSNADYRDKWVEVATSPNDYATGDSSLILATVPFLPPGDTFVDVPLYPVGLCQSFSWNEGLMGQFIPEIGSGRKVNTAGSAAGSGAISKIQVHGNSLVTSLYRPTFYFMLTVPELAAIRGKLFTDSNNLDWIKGLALGSLDLFSVELDGALDRVVATGGMNSLLYKVPFGLMEVKRDAKNRVLSISYFEQCALRGNQGGLSAGQFQVVESLSFEYERMRPLTVAGMFQLSSEALDGLK